MECITANNKKKKKKPPLTGKSNLCGADLEGGGASNLTGADRGRMWILDVEQPGYFLPTMHSAPRQPSRRVKQTTALHCQRLRIAFISPLFTLSYAKLFFIVCCTNNSVNGDDLAFFRIPNEASERERRGI